MRLVVVVSIVVSVLSDAHCRKRIYGANGDSKAPVNL
jgi:cobalamin synthase